jgi:hypothetical protein
MMSPQVHATARGPASHPGKERPTAKTPRQERKKPRKPGHRENPVIFLHFSATSAEDAFNRLGPAGIGTVKITAGNHPRLSKISKKLSFFGPYALAHY